MPELSATAQRETITSKTNTGSSLGATVHSSPYGHLACAGVSGPVGLGKNFRARPRLGNFTPSTAPPNDALVDP